MNIEYKKIGIGDLVGAGTKVYEICFVCKEVSIFIRAKDRIKLQSIIDTLPVAWDKHCSVITFTKFRYFNERIKNPDDFSIGGLIPVGKNAYIFQKDLCSFKSLNK